ncbi:4'-phosphopantetheinyl transferase family protein [Azotobacter armeniacus]
MQPLQLPESLAPDVDVWRLDLELAAPVADADWIVLDQEEGVRALRFHRHEDRVRFVATRAALRRLLAARLQCTPQALHFGANPHGKPRLVGEPGGEVAMDFNVSHAGGFALIALSRRGAVGVDIERCNPDFDTVSLEPQVLSPLEHQMGANRRPGFFERWVVKEAVLKALGLGVAEHLKQLTVLKPEQDDGRSYGLHHACSEWPSVGAWRLEAPPGYAAALAWTPACQTKELQ